MIECRFEDICRAVGGTMLQSGAETALSISTDSRHIDPGDLFVPLVGEKFDGHAYLRASLEAGAAGCLTAREETEPVPGKCYIRVKDTEKALQQLAAWYRTLFALPVVEITGSAGKTTTKEMIAYVLQQHYRTLKTEANFNNQVGIPQTILRLRPEDEVAVVETGMNGFDQLRHYSAIVRPNIAVITNIGDAHIGNVGNTRQGVLQAKLEMLEHLDPEGIVVLCGDDELLKELKLPFTTVLCGTGENCGVRVGEIRDRGILGIDCTVTTARDSYHLSIPSPGEYMIYPASMAVAIGEYLGLTRSEIEAGVAAYVPTGSRMRRVACSQGRMVIDDCYNANPPAMKAALQVLAGTDRRRVAVLGDMGDLGAMQKSGHRQVGEFARTLGLDAFFAVGPMSKDMAAGYGEGAQYYPDMDSALPAIRAAFTPDTVLLVKASHAMQFGNIVKELEQL